MKNMNGNTPEDTEEVCYLVIFFSFPFMYATFHFTIQIAHRLLHRYNETLFNKVENHLRDKIES